MLWFSEEDRDSEVEASDYLIGDLDLVTIWIWWQSGSGDYDLVIIWIWWSGDYDLVRWLGGMAAQAAAVLRDKRKRWENHFCIFTQFSAKLGWETWSTYFNRNLASQVRDGSLKRRGRTTPQFRSVKKKSKKSFFVKFQNFLAVRDFFSAPPPNISICSFLYIFSILW